MSKHMNEILREAVAQGLLADATREQTNNQRHWSVVVLTAVASWFSAVPLLLGVGMLLWPVIKNWPGCFLVGGLILAASIMLLQSATVPLFVEQIGVPCLLTGGLLIGVGADDLTGSSSGAAALLIPVAGVVAWLVPRAWLRSLLGAAIVGLIAFSLSEARHYDLMLWPHGWMAWHTAAGTWLALQALQQRIALDRASAPVLSFLEALSNGMAALTLAGLAVFSGNTFLLGAITGSFSSLWWLHANGDSYSAIHAVSTVLAALGAAWLASAWPALRTWWFGVLAGLLLLAAWFLPSLGVVLLMMSACAGTRRYALAALAGVSAMWMIGGLYYQWDWPLATKAGLLVGIGIAMGAIALFGIPGKIELPLASPVPQPQRAHQPDRKRRLGLLLSGVAVLAVANIGIWQKETLIRTGTAVFIELAPVDPRSLMQGDYMRLRFVLPSDGPALASRAIARMDARGVATLLRLDDGKPLAAGEFPIQLVEKNNSWTIASDAWYFKEGEGERWAAAKYGEFRIDRDGHALLVGLRGADLKKL